MTSLDMPPNATRVHNAGFVALIQHCADDLGVANAARVSFAKKSQLVCPGCQLPEDECEAECPTRELPGEEGLCRLSNADAGLINFLASGKHGTPFEHNMFTFHVKAPLFVLREWHRHRIGWSYNEWSARYSKMEPDFYVPNRDSIRTQVGKPGAYTFERVEDDDVANTVMNSIRAEQYEAYARYEERLAQGIAKEVARVNLPVSIYSQMYATCNARSLMNFLALRNSPHAQAEIRAYAEAMEAMLAEVMPHTHEVFVANGRVAP